MSVNNQKPHLLVLPEDERNRELANGFLLDPGVRHRMVQVLPKAGGWLKVLAAFEENHVFGLRKFPDRHLVLLIDFDEQVEERLERFRTAFPAEVADRVFILGSLDEPEPLRKAVGRSLESIGQALALACADGEPGLWSHPMLAHNQGELDRLTHKVKPFLFV